MCLGLEGERFFTLILKNLVVQMKMCDEMLHFNGLLAFGFQLDEGFNGVLRNRVLLLSFSAKWQDTEACVCVQGVPR